MQYSLVDAAILADIRQRPRRGYRDFGELVWSEATKHDTHKGKTGGYFVERVIDRRLQSLRKRGLIVFNASFWRLNPST